MEARFRFLFFPSSLEVYNPSVGFAASALLLSVRADDDSDGDDEGD